MGIISKEIYIYCGNMCSFFFFFLLPEVYNQKSLGANDLEKAPIIKGAMALKDVCKWMQHGKCLSSNNKP